MDSLLWPQYSQDEIDAVVRVLKSGKTNQWSGQEVFQFEKEFSEYLSSKHCIAVSNGSLALEVAWAALGLELGDEVIVPARTFIASASSIVIKNGIPIFADIDMNSQNIEPDSIEELITLRTKAILCVHHAGCPCDMDKILKIAKKNNLKVVEDCAQATGAMYKGHKVGTFGDIGCFSFCQDKIMSTGGEGGMLSTDSDELWQKMWSFKDHGRNFEKIKDLKPQPSFPYLCDTIGSNCRMTEMQAAIGRIKLTKIDKWIEQRRESAEMFDKCFSNYPFIHVPTYSTDFYHPFYEYYVFVKPENLLNGWTSETVLLELQEIGIPCNRGSCPEIYREKTFEKYKYPDGSIQKLSPKYRLKNAKALGENAIKILIHPGYSRKNIEDFINKIKKLFDTQI
ncbi:MAG: DegT/DnrJ/EryC1/StrS family aminotransferase [Bacteroidetes bacterium]|nr:DegT/DnrJ/EryC1/StrS family aminotransferase [Bacteroidota bacterium]